MLITPINVNNFENIEWVGTFNKGLYYWPGITESYHIPKGVTSESRYKPVDSQYGLLFNDDKVYKTNITRHEFVEIFDRTKIKMRSASILDVACWNDTTAVLMRIPCF